MAKHDEDLPEWTDDQLDRAELAISGKVVRPANGTLSRAGEVSTDSEVTLWVDEDVIERFREGGPGWQDRMSEALRKAVGL